MEPDRVSLVANCTERPERQVLGVVLHDTEGSLEGSIAWWNRPGTGSAHYLIGKSGELVQCVGEEYCAWHVRDCDRAWPAWLPAFDGPISAANVYTVGVELELLQTDPAGAYTDVQLARCRALVCDLLERYGLGLDRVIRHGDVQLDRSDPRGLTVAQLLNGALPTPPPAAEQPIAADILTSYYHWRDVELPALREEIRSLKEERIAPALRLLDVEIARGRPRLVQVRAARAVLAGA